MCVDSIDRSDLRMQRILPRGFHLSCQNRLLISNMLDFITSVGQLPTCSSHMSEMSDFWDSGTCFMVPNFTDWDNDEQSIRLSFRAYANKLVRMGSGIKGRVTLFFIAYLGSIT